jgi:hypothetical protein
LSTGSSHRLVVDLADATWVTPPLRSARITRHQRYYERVRPCAPLPVLNPSRCCRFGALPLDSPGGPRARPALSPVAGSSGDRFPRSARDPASSSRHLYAGHHLASRQVPARLVPGSSTHPGFDAVSTCFDTSTVVHSRSSSRRSPDPILVGPCPQRSPPRLLTDAACGGLTPPPAGRRRRATPPSLAQLRTCR